MLGDDAVIGKQALGFAGGAAFRHAKHQLREDLGDVLWYVAILADRFGLGLDDIAVASLVKAADRWKATPGEPLVFDENYPESERLPRRAVFTFAPTTLPDGRAVIASFNAWRRLHATGGRGTLTADLLSRTLTALPADC